MSDHAFKKVAADSALAVCQDLEIDEAGRALLAPELAPAAYLRLLMDAALYPDAVRFLARALPKREATWWACLCARAVLGDSPATDLVKALEAAEQWVRHPTEEHRQLAYPAAEATRFGHPASWAAMAAFWSGGSIAPPNVPVLPPADDLTAKAVAGAVMLAAVQAEPEKAAAKYRRFLEQGIDIACGGSGRLKGASQP
jgi:hypothetical protein